MTHIVLQVFVISAAFTQPPEGVDHALTHIHFDCLRPLLAGHDLRPHKCSSGLTRANLSTHSVLHNFIKTIRPSVSSYGPLE